MDSMKAGKGDEDIRKANEDLGPLKDDGEGDSRESREICVSVHGEGGRTLKGVLGVLLVV